jgi:hypothetical protein
MKLEEMRYRETQQQHFGKRGMSYHGAVLYVSRGAVTIAWSLDGLLPDASTYPYQMYYFDDLVRNSQQQDSVAAVSLLEAIIRRIKQLFPATLTVSFQADNAAAYASPFLVFMLPLLCAAVGLRATEFVHNEAGDGKTVLDGHFGVQTQMIKVCVCLCLVLCTFCCWRNLSCACSTGLCKHGEGRYHARAGLRSADVQSPAQHYRLAGGL